MYCGEAHLFCGGRHENKQILIVELREIIGSAPDRPIMSQ
jgi:hypothetical protein